MQYIYTYVHTYKHTYIFEIIYVIWFFCFSIENSKYFNDMVQFSDHDKTTQCVVYDQTPDSEQKKINIIVRPAYTVGKVIGDIKTQYRYDKFELLMQPVSGGDLVYLNERQNELLYKIDGFEPQTKNLLIILPFNTWDGNVKKRYEFSTKSSLKTVINGSATPPPPPPLPPTKSTFNNSFNKTTTITTTTAGATDNNIAPSVKAVNGKSLIKKNHQNHMASSSILHDTSNDEVMENTNALSPPSSMTTVTNATNTDSLNLSPMSDPDPLSDDDLALGASASPTETEPMQCGGPLSLTHGSVSSAGFNFGTQINYDTINRFNASSEALIDSEKKYSLSQLPAPESVVTPAQTNNGYVGLVNQAMTCYLNSLLQGLYMTPEFHNALYRWEFDNDNEAKNIPYQLQKLFLNLQVSHLKNNCILILIILFVYYYCCLQ